MSIVKYDIAIIRVLEYNIIRVKTRNSQEVFMEFMSAREAADKWGISQRRVAVLCSEQRIKEATMVGNMWIIPSSAEKPIDARSTRYNRTEGKAVKPFLKWAGGKGQLLKEIEHYYPFKSGKITKYAEPFVGGGAVLFDILSKRWGCSSPGRASALQAEGSEFDPRQLHQFALVLTYNGM